MTPERLEGIRKTYYDPLDPNSEWRISVGQHINNAEELLDEVDRLRAENANLREAAGKALTEMKGAVPLLSVHCDCYFEAIDALREALEAKE